MLHFCKAELFSGLVFGTIAHSQLLGGLLLAGRVGSAGSVHSPYHQWDLKCLSLKRMTDFNENTLLLGERRDREGAGKPRVWRTCVPTTPSEGSRSHQKCFYAVKAECLIRCATTGLALSLLFHVWHLPSCPRTGTGLLGCAAASPRSEGSDGRPSSGQQWPVAMLNPLHRTEPPVMRHDAVTSTACFPATAVCL